MERKNERIKKRKKKEKKKGIPEPLEKAATILEKIVISSICWDFFEFTIYFYFFFLLRAFFSPFSTSLYRKVGILFRCATFLRSFLWEFLFWIWPFFSYFVRSSSNLSTIVNWEWKIVLYDQTLSQYEEFFWMEMSECSEMLS